MDKSYLKLSINDPNLNISEPPISALILQVKALPPSINSLTLYNLFRPFGPLFSCRTQFQDNKFKGALVQFYKQDDAEAAMNALVMFYIFLLILQY